MFNTIKTDRIIFVVCAVAIIIGIILMCLIMVVDGDGDKIVLGSIGGVLIVVSLIAVYFTATIKIPASQDTELRKMAAEEAHKGPDAITTV